MNFYNLGLTSLLEETIGKLGYVTPTPIQEQSIPSVLMGRDIFACAQTGTGKTGAFLLPLVDILSHCRAKTLLPRVIIIEPTRELAAQVQSNFEMFTSHTGLKSGLIVGGEFWGEQDKFLRKGIDVIIGTPGRLYDLIERQKVILADIQIVVIDEADRLLDMGFFPDIERILSFLVPAKKRQTLLFSATLPKEVQELSAKFLNNPLYIESSKKNSTAVTIKQYAFLVEEEDKRKAARSAIKYFNPGKVIIFCNRKSDVDILKNSMRRKGFNAEAIHGDLDQSKRTETLNRFRDNKFQVLIASDVVARGVDVTDVDLVINFDISINTEDYIHRIGRTGRGGSAGTSVTLVTPKNQKQLKKIESFIGQEVEILPKEILFPKEKVVFNEREVKVPRTPSFEREDVNKKPGFGDHVPAFMFIKIKAITI